MFEPLEEIIERAYGQKFENFYVQTLVSYERLFKERPPSDNPLPAAIALPGSR